MHVLGRYQYLLLALVGQLYVLLLISVSAELYGVLGLPHSTVINGLSLVSLVVLALLAMMQWTYPVSNEVPVIVLLVWIMLSTQGNSAYCLCCDHHHLSTTTTSSTITTAAKTLELPAPNATNATVVVVAPGASNNETIEESTIVDDDRPRSEDDDVVIEDSGEDAQGASESTRLHSDGQYVMNAWLAHVHGCRRESLVWLYAALALVMLAASLLADLRYFYLAFVMRLAVALLVVVLLLLLAISPASCSQFNASDSFTLILRITLYHVLWFMNQYKDVTELVLLMAYSQGLRFSNLVTGHRKNNNNNRLSIWSGRGGDHKPDTPCGVMLALDANAARLRRRQYNEHHQHSEANNRGDVAIAVERATPHDVSQAGAHLEALLTLLVDEGHQLYYSGAWLANTLSWKHRAYGHRLYQLIGLARTVWVLVVPSLLMLVLAPLLAAWLLYHIALNKRELRHACKHTGLIEFYLAQQAEQQQK